MHKSIKQEISRGQYEYNDEGGLYLPKSKVNFQNVFSNDVLRDGKLLGEEYSSNLVVTEGLNETLESTLAGVTPVTQWYLGIYEGNYTPQATDTGATIAASSTESSSYTEAVRQNLTLGSVASGSVNNDASKATFSINASVTIYGVMCISTSTINDVAGTLFSASKFASGRPLISGDSLIIGYTVTVTDA